MLYLCCMLDFFLLETRECPLNPTKPLVFLQNMGSLEQRLGMGDHTDTLSWFSLFGFLGQSASFSPCCRPSVSSTLVSTCTESLVFFDSVQAAHMGLRWVLPHPAAAASLRLWPPYRFPPVLCTCIKLCALLILATTMSDKSFGAALSQVVHL